MSFARHLAWSLNPNLSERDVVALIERDLNAQQQRMNIVCEHAKKMIAEGRREDALRYVAMCLPLVLA